MRKLWKPLLTITALTVPLFAGALRLEVGNPAANPEAVAKQAVLVARITACHSPEKTTVTATAEGIVNGVRKRVPLKVIALAAPGTYAVTREWPDHGSWAVKMIATNTEYKDYATSVVVPLREKSPQFSAAKQYYHAATDSEVATSLN